MLHVPGTDTDPREAGPGSTDDRVSAGIVAPAPSEEAHEAQLRVLGENLRDLEERLHHKGARLIELEREIEQFRHERRAAAERLAAADGALRQLQERDARLRELEARGLDEEAFARAIAERDRMLVFLRRELAEAQTRTLSHLETLQTLEARRGIWDLLLDGLDRQIDEREARLAGMEAELSRRAARANELATELATRTARNEALLEEVSSLTAALASERTDHARSADEASVQIAAQEESIARLQGDVREATGRAQELEADLRAAEDTIHRLETELRGKSLRLEELAKAAERWRQTAEANGRSLDERNARTHPLEADADCLEADADCLEADAANGGAPLGSMQQTSERLVPPPPADAQPSAEGAPPEGATRLLVRRSGESEVVHVLGRKTMVGRTPDNDLQIDAHFISRHHAVILAGPVQTIIEDLNSTNGVRVNSRRVTREVLKDGDVVMIGRTQFRFSVRQAAQRS